MMKTIWMWVAVAGLAASANAMEAPQILPMSCEQVAQATLVGKGIKDARLFHSEEHKTSTDGDVTGYTYWFRADRCPQG